MSNCARSTEGVVKAERAVIRAAMGVVNSDGWSFQTDNASKLNVVLFPGSMRRLESAIARLREARKQSRARRRKYT